MMIRKTLTILAASCMMYSCGTKTESNPFFTEFQTEYGVPSFDKIKLEHYEPAFLKESISSFHLPLIYSHSFHP